MDDVLDLSIEIDPPLPPTQVEMRPAVDQIERRYDDGEALKRRPDLSEDAYFAWQDATADDLSKISGWRSEIAAGNVVARELKRAGFDIDLNVLAL